MKSRAVRREELTTSERDAMYELLNEHFEGVTRAGFEADLSAKNWVVMLLDDANRPVGFSTLVQYRTIFKGSPYGVIYSGDTIVAPSHWGSLVLPKIWIQTVRDICAAQGLDRVLWLLISSGYRTYRFLPVFWRHFYPRYDQPTPSAVQRLIDRLGGERFGADYDPRTGLVAFDQPQRLRGRLATIPEGKLQDPHIAFFARRNPGFADGDQLVCLTELCVGNLTAAGRRLYGPTTASEEPSL